MPNSIISSRSAAGWKGIDLPDSSSTIALFSAIDSPSKALGHAAADLQILLMPMRFEAPSSRAISGAIALWAAPLDAHDADHLPAIARLYPDHPFIVETPPALLDTVWHHLSDHPQAQILVAPEPVDALAVLLTVQSQRGPMVRDSGKPDVRQLIGDLRILLEHYAHRLAQAESGEPAPFASGIEARFARPLDKATHVAAAERSWGARPSGTTHALMALRIRTLLRQRKLRAEIFGSELFADPSWDMLLDLYASTLEGRRVSVSSLCMAAEVPHATAWRRLSVLIDRRILQRQDDPDDGRRSFVSFTPNGRAMIDAFFARSDALEPPSPPAPPRQ